MQCVGILSFPRGMSLETLVALSLSRPVFGQSTAVEVFPLCERSCVNLGVTQVV